jgi:hypothetical protein
MGHPKIKNFSGLSRVIKGVPKKCGKQDDHFINHREIVL